ncbi:MAG: arylsulfatase A-like enzyme, partial [Planctomycetota bacterium]
MHAGAIAPMKTCYLALIALTVLASCQTVPAPTRAPNIVMIIADDQAWGDFGFMGHPDIKTPHLDQLAARSAVFERGYVPSSLCRPSLATMITGLYPHQHLITGNDPPKGVQRDRMLKHIAAVPTLPRLLAPRGYRSLQTGKWWEGNCQCGGFTEGMTHGEPKRGGRHGDKGLQIGRKTMRPIFDFVADCGDDPFLLWYAPLLPHTPHNPPERLLANYQKPGRSIHVARYFAMCEWFDETCGQLLDDLDQRGLRENTIVLFVSDNGWIQRTDRRGYAPRSKRSPYEGGVRTPIMISWPGHVTPGRREQLASSIDFAPTVLRACGVASQQVLPGRDLVALAESKTTERQTVFGEIFAHDVADVDDPSRSLLYRWFINDRWKLIVPTA